MEKPNLAIASATPLHSLTIAFSKHVPKFHFHWETTMFLHSLKNMIIIMIHLIVVHHQSDSLHRVKLYLNIMIPPLSCKLKSLKHWPHFSMQNNHTSQITREPSYKNIIVVLNYPTARRVVLVPHLCTITI